MVIVKCYINNMNKAQKQIIKEWRKGQNQLLEVEQKLKQSPHNICSGCGETIRPDQWSKNNFTLCIDCA